MNNLLRSIKISAFIIISMWAMYYSAGIEGWGIAVYMIIIFEIWHQKVHGYSIADLPDAVAPGYDTPIPWWMYALITTVVGGIFITAWVNSRG